MMKEVFLKGESARLVLIDILTNQCKKVVIVSLNTLFNVNDLQLDCFGCLALVMIKTAGFRRGKGRMVMAAISEGKELTIS